VGVLDLLDELCHDGLAVLVATHDPAVTARADQVLSVYEHRLVPLTVAASERVPRS
jgi:ABC-type lipoprotein export system ATPase subunit